MAELVKAGRYEQVKTLNARLIAVKEDFRAMQLEDVRRQHEVLRSYFWDAGTAAMEKSRQRLQEEDERMKERIADRREKLAGMHNIQCKNLGLQLTWQPQPQVKYSKKFLELQHAEASLVRLRQFNEAQLVRGLLDRLQPVEEHEARRRFDASVAARLEALRKRQDEENKRLEQTEVDIRLHEKRLQRAELDTLRATLLHSELAMRHDHQMAALRKPELSEHPSALWQRRRGYRATGAGHRGEQLAAAARGRRSGASLATADLTQLHDFDAVVAAAPGRTAALSGTVTMHDSVVVAEA
ncbi:unnamed protein product [Phaeothamnion confervicola]